MSTNIDFVRFAKYNVRQPHNVRFGHIIKDRMHGIFYMAFFTTMFFLVICRDECEKEIFAIRIPPNMRFVFICDKVLQNRFHFFEIAYDSVMYHHEWAKYKWLRIFQRFATIIRLP